MGSLLTCFLACGYTEIPSVPAPNCIGPIFCRVRGHPWLLLSARSLLAMGKWSPLATLYWAWKQGAEISCGELFHPYHAAPAGLCHKGLHGEWGAGMGRSRKGGTESMRASERTTFTGEQYFTGVPAVLVLPKAE